MDSNRARRIDDHLAERQLKSSKSITLAAQAIDKQLRSNPSEKGESRPDGERILIELPLGVNFKVRADKNEVEVGHVWLIRSRKHS